MDKGKKSFFAKLWPWGKKEPKKAEDVYVPVNTSIKKLSTEVKGKFDVFIAGDVHDLQSAQTVRKEILEVVQPDITMFEIRKTLQKQIDNKTITPVTPNGVVNESLKYALKKGIPARAVDEESCENPTTVRLATTLAQRDSGEVAQLNLAYTLSNSWLTLHGKPEAAQFTSNAETQKEVLKEYLKQFGKDLPKFHRDNLKEAAADYDLAAKTDFISKAIRKYDKYSDNKKINHDAKIRKEEGDKVMAQNVYDELEKARKAKPDAKGFLADGASHNEGIKKYLEEKGLKVASIRILNHPDSELDGRVYQKIAETGEKKPDWIVSVNEEVRRAQYDVEDFNRALEKANALRATSYTEPEPEMPVRQQSDGVAPNYLLPPINKNEVEL